MVNFFHMGLSTADSRFSRSQRLRSRALWAFLVAAIGFCAVLVGLAQYVGSGQVSILHGREPLRGDAALESLLFLSFSSAAFALVGIAMRRRAKPQGAS